jgi:hypothetical protein
VSGQLEAPGRWKNNIKKCELDLTHKDQNLALTNKTTDAPISQISSNFFGTSDLLLASEKISIKYVIRYG